MSSSSTQALKRTALYERHRDAGARLVEFAGWEMPVYYAGPPAPMRAEHMAVRRACGVFDVSHMGQIETSGAQALELLQRLISNDVAAIAFAGGGGVSDGAGGAPDRVGGGPDGVGGAQYGLLCREDGGVLDDVFTYRVDHDRYLTVTNASNHARDLEWFRAHAQEYPEARVRDRIDAIAMLAVQGPSARSIAGELCAERADLPALELPRRMSAARRRLAGADVLVCGTGYTGEDGVELLCRPQDAGALWDELVARGAVPAGLGARDTLRLEACFHLYGNDLSPRRGPIEAGLGWCCSEETGFIGADAVRAARKVGTPERLVAFAIEGPGIARPGNPVVGGGEVTSGTLSPTLGMGIGLAYVPAARAEVGTPLQIDVRGKMRSAVVKQKPLYRKPQPGAQPADPKGAYDPKRS